MHPTCKTFSLLLFLSLVCINSFAQRASFTDTIQKIDALSSQWNTQTPGGVLTVSRQGTILYYRAFGMADLEHNLANTPETVFEAGSVSKQFTAAAILLLVQDGKLSLEDLSISKYNAMTEFSHSGATAGYRENQIFMRN